MPSCGWCTQASTLLSSIARLMREITVLVTASGAPGTAALLRALRMNGERRVRLIGTDMSPQAVGRHFCDQFYVVPPGGDDAFADAVLDIVRRDNVDAVLPQSSFDLLGLAEAKERFDDNALLVSPPETIRRANDKAAAYAALESIGVRAPATMTEPGIQDPPLPENGSSAYGEQPIFPNPASPHTVG